MIRKELHLEEAIVATLEKEAKKQNRSLKNYLEHLVIQHSRKLEMPSPAYMKMMDDIVDKFENDQLNFSNIEEVLKKNGLSD